MTPMEQAAFRHYEITGEVYVIFRGREITMVTAKPPSSPACAGEDWRRVWRPHLRFSWLAMRPMGDREALFKADLERALASA